MLRVRNPVYMCFNKTEFLISAWFVSGIRGKYRNHIFFSSTRHVVLKARTEMPKILIDEV
jgi:hypothetical protein